MKAKAKVKISIGEVKEQNKNITYIHKNTQQTQQIQNTQNIQQTSLEELSPTHFLSVSKLKSSIQNIFS